MINGLTQEEKRVLGETVRVSDSLYEELDDLDDLDGVRTKSCEHDDYLFPLKKKRQVKRIRKD